jgi:RimJ/RimL family protein N-acetyltransferase
MSRVIIEYGALVALEPTHDEITRHAEALAAGYNEPTNAELMGHTAVIPPADVIDSYTESIAAGMRAFLLFEDSALVGDADLRGIRGTTAEFAFMIAARAAQGKGFGTRFALMVHAFGFRALELETIYASVVPHNTASRRVFEKLGYVLDDSAAAREYADEPGDVTLSLDRATFGARHGAVLDQIQIAMR